MSETQHTFVVPVYGETPWLPVTIESLRDQTALTSIIVTTSAPTAALRDLCNSYGLPLVVRDGTPGIGRDWNFALEQVTSGWVTIAHQDDIYLPRYVEDSLAAAAADTLLVWSDYRELIEDEPRAFGVPLMVKWLMIEAAFFPGRIRLRSRMRKRLLFGLGDPVCCPSAMIHRERAADFRFAEHLDLDLDWEAWLRVCQLPGSLAYVRRTNVLHRLHHLSATTRGIADRKRRHEDEDMFLRMWPRPIARALAGVYALCYRFNA